MNKPRHHRRLSLLPAACMMALFSGGFASAQDQAQLVRMAQIQVDSAQLDRYNALLQEEIEASIRIEPGVLTLYAVANKEHPTHITIFETYASTDAYKAHLETPHFKKYKTGTTDMVKALKLVQTNPILLRAKPGPAPVQSPDLIVQMANIQIDAAGMATYTTALREGMNTAIQVEPGVLTLYAVAEKENPTHITVLEVYANADAYKAHLATPHFKKYKTSTAELVKSLDLIRTVPVRLGAKSK